jgi:hypothetical protein
VIGKNGIYENFCFTWKKKVASAYNLGQANQLDLECTSRAGQPMPPTQNCRIGDSEKCDTCARGFYLALVAEKFSIKNQDGSIDISNPTPQQKCVQCKSKNCDLCYNSNGKCYSCKVGFYFSTTENYCLKIKPDQVYDS